MSRTTKDLTWNARLLKGEYPKDHRHWIHIAANHHAEVPSMTTHEFLTILSDRLSHGHHVDLHDLSTLSQKDISLTPTREVSFRTDIVLETLPNQPKLRVNPRGDGFLTTYLGEHPLPRNVYHHRYGGVNTSPTLFVVGPVLCVPGDSARIHLTEAEVLRRDEGSDSMTKITVRMHGLFQDGDDMEPLLVLKDAVIQGSVDWEALTPTQRQELASYPCHCSWCKSTRHEPKDEEWSKGKISTYLQTINAQGLDEDTLWDNW